MPDDDNYIKKIMVASTWQDLLGTSIEKRYILRKLVSAGPNQAEYLAVALENDETLVSVALLALEPAEIEHELTAIKRAKQLQHPNLLLVMDGGLCELEGAQLVFIVTEAAQGTLAASPRPNLTALLEDLLEPLEWLHSQNLIYRNLDPETVVRANGHWKLADLSQVHPAGRLEGEEAAIQNAPPEAAAGWILPAWDIWTIGLLLRGLLEGESSAQASPFDAIVRGCLEQDRLRRLSLQDIRRLLKPGSAPEPTARARLELVPAPGIPSRSRVPLVALAAAAILGITLFALFRPHRAAPPPPRTVVSAPPPEKSQTTVPPKIAPAAAAPRSVPPPKAAVVPDPHIGRADYFSDDLEGHPTASGEVFSNNAMTAASRQFPLGARIRVTDLKSKRSVIVRVNDRGPGRPGFIVSITRLAAEELGFVNAGSARVKVELVK